MGHNSRVTIGTCVKSARKMKCFHQLTINSLIIVINQIETALCYFSHIKYDLVLMNQWYAAGGM